MTRAAIGGFAILAAACSGGHDPAPKPSPTPFALPSASAARDSLCLAAATQLADSLSAEEQPVKQWEAELAEGQLARLIVLRDMPEADFSPGGGEFDRAQRLAGAARDARKAMARQPDWPRVRQACAVAYPPNAPSQIVRLPADDFEASKECTVLALWMRDQTDGSAERDVLVARNEEVMEKMLPILTARVKRMTPDEGRRVGRLALRAALQLGRPLAVIDACKARFVTPTGAMTPDDTMTPENAMR